MGFTQPCFIRKNTLELRRKLEELGYIICGTLVITNVSEIMCYDNIAYGCEYPWEYRQKAIDCGTNEELFLALAALRDDSDYMQWFTYNNYWHKCLDNNFSKYAADWILFPNADVWHKATIKEIIEHFKDK